MAPWLEYSHIGNDFHRAWRTRAADGTIKIGYTDPSLRRVSAAVAMPAQRYLQFIIDNINAKGGALGKKFSSWSLPGFIASRNLAEALIALKSVTDQKY